MGVWTLEGECEGKSHACLVDSVTMTVFGPMFDDAEDVESFLAFVGGRDPRRMEDVELRRWFEDYRKSDRAVRKSDDGASS